MVSTEGVGVDDASVMTNAMHRAHRDFLDMAPRSRKGAKKSTTASKNVVLKALVGINGMPMEIIFEVRQIL